MHTEKSRQGGGGRSVEDPLSFSVQVTSVLRKRRNSAGFAVSAGHGSAPSYSPCLVLPGPLQG